MRGILIAVVAVALFVGYTSVFVVQEGSRGIVLRFSKVLRDDAENALVYEPGLHLKMPFIDQVKRLDARIQTMDSPEERFVTIENKDLIVDSYLKWRISDFSRYYLATNGDVLRTEGILKRRLNDRLRSEFGRLEVKEIVQDSRSRFTAVKDSLNGSGGVVPEPGTTAKAKAQSTQTKNTASDILKKTEPATISTEQLEELSRTNLSSLGIEVVDVRIKKINLPTEISEAIFSNMRAEREAVARSERSQGKERAAIIRAETDYNVVVIEAQAERAARIARGEGDAESARIFAEAFREEPEFYSFIRSLTAYEKSFGQQNDVMLLDPKSEFFRYMQNPTPTVQQ